MRPQISWADLVGASVGVWGVGVEGRANLRKLASLGVAPAVIVDDHPASAGPVEGNEVRPADAAGIGALSTCDVVVKSPGVSRYRPDVARIEAAGVPVVGGLGLWLQEVDRRRVVCVTGTKGKSTTTAVAAHLARGLGVAAVAAGNIGRPPWDPETGEDAELWIVETSSFQATDVASSPPVVAVTALHPDHLDWHGGVERYYADKLSLCSQPGGRLTVANGEDPRIRSRRDLLGAEVLWVAADTPDTWVERLGLLGDHNRRNARIAASCLVASGVAAAADPAALESAAPGLASLPSRLHPIGTVAGVTFVDDSLSTNVLSALSALEVFSAHRVALLVGGHDRHIDYAPLARHLSARRFPTLVLALPDTGAQVAAQLEGQVDPASLEVRRVDELDTAVRAGWQWAKPDGVVLLSPAAASFGRYRNWAERAAAFASAMRDCAEGGSVEPGGGR
jgi:UDP-N-acetylmuramoylalanine--D-glutamate ligase